jgi:hypothetical protein
MNELTTTVRTTPARFVSRRAAETISCATLYETAVRHLGTEAVTILAEPGELLHGRFFSSQEPIKLPITFHTLAALVNNADAPDIKIIIEYSIKTFGSDTLASFVFQTLDRMESALKYASPYSELGKKTAANLITAMEVFKAIYSIEELLPSGMTMENFIARFTNLEPVEGNDERVS